MKIFKLSLYCLVFVGYISQIAAQTPAKKQTQSFLITNAIIHIGNGTKIENAALGFANGKITYVGLASDADTKGFDKIINVKGKSIYPGIIAPNTTLGLTEIDAIKPSLDFNEIGELNPNVRALTSFNPESKLIPTLRFNGVLTAQSTPRGGIISGQSAIMSLNAWNWEDAVLKADDGIHINWPKKPNLRNITDETRKENVQKNYENNLKALKQIMVDAKAYAEMDKNDTKNLKLEALKGLFTSEKNLFLHVNGPKEIMESALFFKNLGIQKIVLVGASDVWRISDFVKSNNFPVILDRVHALPEREDELPYLNYHIPKKLLDAGILFCLNYEGDMEAMGNRNLIFTAGTAAAYGVPYEEALKLVTLNTAKILGIDKQLGSIEIGKNATFFVCEGDALDMKTNQLIMAFINGAEIELNSSQLDLYKKYKSKYGLE